MGAGPVRHHGWQTTMGIIVQGGHGFRGHEAGAPDRPFVVLLQQDRADKAASALSWAQAAAMKAETTRRPLLPAWPARCVSYMNPALPGGVHQLGDRGLNALVGVRDYELHAPLAAPSQLAQELGSEGGLRGADLVPRTSHRPSGFKIDPDGDDHGDTRRGLLDECAKVHHLVGHRGFLGCPDFCSPTLPENTSGGRRKLLARYSVTGGALRRRRAPPQLRHDPRYDSELLEPAQE
jgi:hypothetical protein